jgi:hypothetical protein
MLSSKRKQRFFIGVINRFHGEDLRHKIWAQVIHVRLERRFGISRAGHHDACRITERFGDTPKELAIILQIAARLPPPSSMMQTLQRGVGIHLHFRLIVSGESVHFCFPVIDPYDRVMKLAHFEVSYGKWDAGYDGLVASAVRELTESPEMSRDSALRALSHPPTLLTNRS